MHSFLISSKDKKKTFQYIQTFCKENKIDPIDVNLFSSEKAVGIEDVREIQKKLFLRPLKSPMKISILDASCGLTTEAQNSLLKMLEEPPNNTIIMLLVSQKEMVLPTILSRCKIVELKETLSLNKSEFTQYLNILISLSRRGVGEKLKLASDITKNEGETLIWLERTIIVARQKLIETYSKKPSTPQYLNILISLQKTYTLLKATTVNKRFALENLFLNL